MNRRQLGILSFVLLFIISSSCSSPPATPVFILERTPTASPLPAGMPGETSLSVPQATEVIPITGHSIRPADVPSVPEKLVYDVQSSNRKRAPYGDSYNLNRLERPFLQDMHYIPDLDIVSFHANEDADWYYISIQLAGQDPNNPLGIHYGVEIDRDMDGFGDFLIWAGPPYSADWDTGRVQVFSDSNRDSAGQSSAKSDAVYDGDGYETLVFDGASGGAADPDLAWVRTQAGQGATVQFAFKKSLSGPVFLAGVVADAGLKDVTRYDYNDYFKEAEAGSPLKNAVNYPLGLVFAVDNTCWEAYGVENPYTVAKVCPPPPEATATNQPRENTSPTRAPTSQAPPTRVPPTNVPPPTEPPPTEPPPTDPPAEPTEPQQTEPPLELPTDILPPILLP